MFKKIIAFILSLSIVLTAIPVVFAEETATTHSAVSGGSTNSYEEPYIVCELPEKRSEDTKHFLMSDRSIMAAVYEQPVHYKDGEEWKDINNNLSVTEDLDEYENQANSIHTKFAKKSNNKKLATLKKEDFTVYWSLDNAEKVSAEVMEQDTTSESNLSSLKNLVGSVTYSEIQNYVDLQYVVSSNTVKENIILKDKNAPAEYNFTYETKKLDYRVNDNGEVELYDEDNDENVVFVIEKPYMYDSANVRSNDVEMQVEATKKGFTLTVKPDEEWLSSEDRVWPVVIDPSTTTGVENGIVDAYIDITQKLYEASNNYLLVGTYKTAGNYASIYRTLIRFNTLPNIGKNSTVIKAALQIAPYPQNVGGGMDSEIPATSQNVQVNVHKVLDGWPDSGIAWSAFSYDEEVQDYFIYKPTQTDSAYTADITQAVNDWYVNGTNKGILLESAAPSATEGVMQFTSSDFGTTEASMSWRPRLTVVYRNNVGLEGYWSYTTQNAGDRGASSVNNHNGNLVYSHSDVSYNSGINGFTLSHVYNSAEAVDQTTATGAAIKYGSGWRLSLVQTLETPNITADNIEKVYTDGDGTKHYFVKLSDGRVVDEDGLGYTLTTITETETEESGTTTLTHQIKGKDDTVLKFDQSGYLRRIVDTNSNTIKINYSTTSASKQYLTSVTTSSGGNIELVYDSNYYLTQVKDNANRTTAQFTYNNGFLTKITYLDGTSTDFTYNQNGNYRMTEVHHSVDQCNYYGYDGYNRINAVNFKGSNDAVGSSYTFDYEYNQTTITDNRNRSIIYQFDTFGRPTCAYDSEGNAVSQSYTANSNTQSEIFKNNKINLSSNNVRYIENFIKNGSFTSNLANWQSNTAYEEVSDVQLVTGEGLMSSNSVKITHSEATTTKIYQNITNYLYGTFTVTAYVRSPAVYSSLSNGSYGSAFEIHTSNGRTLRSDFNSKMTDVAINNGYEKMSFTVELAEGERLTSVGIGLFNSTGTIYIDCVQLEEGDSSNKINLLSNSGFEADIADINVTPTDFTTDYTNNSYVSGGGHSGSNSLCLTGDADDHITVVQSVPVSGEKGAVYSFGAWAQSNATPRHADQSLPNNITFDEEQAQNTESTIKVEIRITNNDGTIQRVAAEFNEYVSAWQFATKTVVAKKPHGSVAVYVCCYENANPVYFDDLYLYKDTAQSYVYDSNGNVTSTADNAKQQSNFEYSGNYLSKMLEADGTGFEYIYDSKNNLVGSRSSEGLQTFITNNSQGNPTSTVVGVNNYSAALQSGKSYYIRLKGSGKYLSIPGSSTNNYASAQQEAFTGNSNQRWVLEASPKGGYYLHPEYLQSKSLHITNSYNYDGASVAIYNNNQENQQIFDISPQTDFTYKLTPRTSSDGKVIAVADYGTQNVVTLRTAVDTGDDNQSWYFEAADISATSEIEDGMVYQLRARNSGRYANVIGGAVSSGTGIIQYEQLNTNFQKYIVKRYEDTDYYIISPLHATNMLLGVSNTTSSYGYKALKIYDSTIADNKLFTLEYYSSKKGFRIIPKAYPTECVKVSFGSTVNNSDLATSTVSNADNEYFIFEPISKTINSSSTYQDNGNYLHTTTDSLGNTTTYDYDFAKGLQTAVTNAKGVATNYTYEDNTDRLKTVSTAGSTVRYDYENFGGIKKITTPSNTVYNFTYDDFHNTKSIAVGTQTLIEHTYDQNNGNLLYSTYGNGAKVGYTYDILDRVTEKLYNDIVKVAFKYDKFGNLYQKQDLFANVTTTYDYDLIGRIQNVKATNGTAMSYAYDDLNRVSSITTETPFSFGTTEYTYGDSALGQKRGLLYSVEYGSSRIDYAYDKLSRLSTRTLNTTTPFVTEYKYQNGAAANTTSTLVKSIKNGNDLLEYTYDSVGNITAVTKNGEPFQSYTYDSHNQLVTADHGELSDWEYTYDNAGNITSVKINGFNWYDLEYTDPVWKDRVTVLNDEPITYDAIGNPLNYKYMTLTWSNGRQLTHVNNESGDIYYTYNADGYRTSKTVRGVKTEYYWLDGVLLGQKSGNNYIAFLYDDSGAMYGLDYNGVIYYYVFNVQGDVIGIVDGTGTSVVQYEYSPYGEFNGAQGPMDQSLGSANPIRYRGYYYDVETGFYYLNSRYYDPSLGRFINADAYVSTGQGVLGNNMYAYCGNNPVNFKDPNGTSFIGVLYGFFETVMFALTISLVVCCVLSIPTVQQGLDDLGKAIDQGLFSLGNAIVGAASSIFSSSSSKSKVEEKDIAKPRAKDPTHHIVAKADPRAAESRQILRDVGIEPVTDPRNLVVLPQSYHASLHTTAYHNYITERLRPVAGDKAGVEATLASLKAEILARSVTGIRWD